MNWIIPKQKPEETSHQYKQRVSRDFKEYKKSLLCLVGSEKIRRKTRCDKIWVEGNGALPHYEFRFTEYDEISTVTNEEVQAKLKTYTGILSRIEKGV